MNGILMREEILKSMFSIFLTVLISVNSPTDILGCFGKSLGFKMSPTLFCVFQESKRKRINASLLHAFADFVKRYPTYQLVLIGPRYGRLLSKIAEPP